MDRRDVIGSNCPAVPPPSISVIAPAGCGKTHLIVESVNRLPEGRALVLTHTNAGVGVVLERLRAKRITSNRCFVDTLDGWCLRLVRSYPRTAGLAIGEDEPQSWILIREAAVRILSHAFCRRIIRSSYRVVYVDEYQDCTREQHAVVKALSGATETRILGDPLQGIYAFGENRLSPVSWSRDICPAFPRKAWTPEPWRWKSNPPLGDFVTRVRHQIISGVSIDLRHPSVNLEGDHPAKRLTILRKAIGQHPRTLAILPVPQQCRHLAKRVGSPYRCIEAVTCDAIEELASLIKVESSGIALPIAVLGLLEICVKDVDKVIPAVQKRIQSVVTKGKASPTVVEAVAFCHRLAASRLTVDLLGLMDVFVKCSPFRPEPLRILRRAARIAGSVDELPEAFVRIRERDRHVGRRLPMYGIGTTLLVKGMEAEHVIVMGIGQMDAAHLYVALSRGTQALTIVSSTQILPPPSRPEMVRDAIDAGVMTS